MYSTSKKLQGGRRKETCRTAMVIPELKKGRTYYFKGRAYRLVDGERVYGKWSAVKRVRIRK